jgi:gliding motility-associated-like protein
MLPYLIGIVINKKLRATIFLSLAVLFISHTGYAQSLGDPIVHITFGSGTDQFAGPLKPDSGSTSYGYVPGSPDDDQYTIANSTTGLNGGWLKTTDHTGDPNGYMMIVNASYTPGLFYTRKVDGLCGSTTYQFSAFIKNILINDGILPNVTFKIETVNGAPLGEASSIIFHDSGWRQYFFTFSIPANTQSVVLKMLNNAMGGFGNDIAIDDILFRPYGTPLAIQSAQQGVDLCPGSQQTVTIKTITPLDPNFAQKLEVFTNGSWVDQSPAGTATSFSFPSPPLPGAYTYRVVKSDAGNINTSACVVSSNTITINVLPLPEAVISAPDKSCQSDSVLFTDQSSAEGSDVASWHWDFGDGQISTQQNPLHLYANGGDYIVKLIVANSAGCTSVAGTKNIHIIPNVNVSFNASTPVCLNQPITFTDVSTSAEGNIISRVWDYEDGTVETKADNSPFQHTYATAGSHPVKLTITTDNGCIITFSKAVVVTTAPIVDFALPEVCYADLSAKFTDKTTMPDNSTGLTYLWNFGDADANAGNPNTSASQNPSHYYGKAQQYQVSLTVTSANNCTSVTNVKTLQVNGSPIPDLEVLNGNALCANQEVYFKNNSSATVGQINKIVIYYDPADLSQQEIDDAPYPGKLYRHTYPALNYPQAQKTYNVRMVAYTGDASACQAEKILPIALLATPIVTFNPPEVTCLNNGPVNLSSFTTESTGIPGSPTFSGAGVSGGFFDPAVVGVGTFVIKCVYTATAASACADTISRSITVKPIPVVDAGADVSILSGAVTTLHATATGDSLRYLWSPIIGLSNDTIPDPVVTTDENMVYTLTVTNGEDCAVTDKVSVTILQPPQVPNMFTPNGDGINDTWLIKYLDAYKDCTVDVFNRYGQKIYSSIGYTVAWDGRFSNKDVPVGVYYYIIDPKYGRKPLSGYVTIIR